MSLDASLRFRQLTDNALTYLSWHEEVMRALQVAGISQIWDDEPAWYFWLGERAYLLRYPGLEERGSELTAVLHAFPLKEELESGTFSAAERSLLEPEHFDLETTTPRFESFARFAGAFVIGEMTITQGDAGPSSLIMSSYRSKWELAWRFTEVFVALQSFYWKTAPVGNPLGFEPQQGVRSVMIPFEEHAASFTPPSGSGPVRQLHYPGHWREYAEGRVRCSATGTCSCSH